jgi:signal recognition particle receptor subunit beta
VKTILERELEKRRESQNGGVGVEGLGEEGERTDMGGLDCGEKEGSAFKFDEWEGGDISFLGTSVLPVSPKKSSENNLDLLSDWLNNNM